MIIAQEKKKTNIAEYILYMFQIEDLIRANKLDIHLIKQNVITKFNLKPQLMEEMTIWYDDLIEKMKTEKIEKSGHFSFVKKYINDLNVLHLQLLSSTEELKYIEQYNWAKSGIVDLQKKSTEHASNEIEICFNGLYGFLLLKLQKKEITRETTEAISTFSNLIALLSKKYMDEADIE